MLTVDLFSIYLLPCVDIVIHYIEVDFTFRLLADYVRYIKEFVILRFVILRFVILRFYTIHNLLQLWPGCKISFVTLRTSLNRL